MKKITKIVSLALVLVMALTMLASCGSKYSAIVIEFKSTKELVEFYESSATAQGLVKDVSENEDVKKMYNALVNAGYANGNCLVLPASILYINEITNIVKSVK